ncbi:MAG: serine hydrolase [Cyanobacteria bacterium J06639_1]
MSESGQHVPNGGAVSSRRPGVRVPRSPEPQLPNFAAARPPHPPRPLEPRPPLPRLAATDLSERLALERVPPKSPSERPKLPEFVERSPRKSKQPRQKGLRTRRIAAVGIGLGLLAGTFARGSRDGVPRDRAIANPNTEIATVLPVPNAPPLPVLDLSAERAEKALQDNVRAIATQTPNLRLGVVLYDVDNGTHASFASGETFPTASTIKVPVVVALLQSVDEGIIQLDELLTLRQDLMAGGSGTMQDRAVGTQVSVLEAATLTVSISDNTATNLLIDRLGGIAALNRRFQEWGLTQTRFSALLPDLSGTNVTSPADMALLLERIEKGELLSRRGRDRLLDIMRQTENDALLPQGLSTRSRIAHKTGNIRSLVGDVGIVDLPNGRRFIAVALVQRAIPNDPAAEQMIQRVSQIASNYWSHSSKSGS